MGLFNKKKHTEEPKGKPLDFDPLNVQIRDLRIGFFVDYNLKTFEITGGFEVTTKEGSFRFMKMDAADEIFWLLVENGTETYIAQSAEVNMVNPGIPAIMQNFGKAPAGLNYRDILYSCMNQSDGKFRDLVKNAMDWNKATCWKYSGNEGTELLLVLQKGQNTFEAWTAKKTDATEFSNFLPRY